MFRFRPVQLTVIEAGSIVLTAEASDDKGVTNVEFYRGNEKIGEDNMAPYEQSVDLTDADNGTLAFTAKATDSGNNATISTPVNVVVDIDIVAPTVMLVASKDMVDMPGSMTLTASATDRSGISKVMFYKNGELLGEDTEAPFQQVVLFTSAEQNGSYNYSAEAVDTRDNEASSEPVTVTVNLDGTPPTLTLMSDKTSVVVAESVVLTADAADDRVVASVDFYRNGVKFAEVASAPYTVSVPFTADDNGVQVFNAVAMDMTGNVADGDAVSVLVDIDITKPSVDLATSKDLVNRAEEIMLMSLAEDNKGIAKVEFYRGNEKIGEDSIAPYEQAVSLTDADNGAVVFRAVATDIWGNSETSTERTVVVDIDVVKPTVGLTVSKTEVMVVESITLTAEASDNKAVAKVEFYKGSTKLGEDSEAPYEYAANITSVDNGTVSFVARAIDIWDNDADSEAVSVMKFPQFGGELVKQLLPSIAFQHH
ncbi:MAG: Ig-like domain-containing protein [Trueperaceae bacterium]